MYNKRKNRRRDEELPAFLKAVALGGLFGYLITVVIMIAALCDAMFGGGV